jgi:hypothetical protein
MAEERVGQVRRPLDAVNASMGLLDNLGQGRAGEVGQLDGLEGGPQALGWVQLRGVGGQRDRLIPTRRGTFGGSPAQRHDARPSKEAE